MIPEELQKDADDLKKRGFDLKIIETPPKIYMRFNGFPLPPGIYNMGKTDLLIFTTSNYPNAGFDMFWTDPELTLKDDRIPNGADSIESHLGTGWRMFSYHPYQQTPWNPADDSVQKHVEYVQQRLCRGD